MLSANNITFRAGGRLLLNNVSLAFHPGKINLILGPNGAGKTTLLRILAGQVKNYQGKIHYGNNPLPDYSNVELARIRAVLSQQTELAFPLTVEQVIMMGRYPHFKMKPGSRDQEAVEKSIELFGLNDFRKRDYLTLSGGEKQRVQFARVIAQVWYPTPGSCRYLFLDEPLSFLDIHYQLNFMNQISEMAKAGDFVVTGIIHDLHLAAKYAEHAVVLVEGSVFAEGANKTVFTKEIIRDVYGVDAQIQETSTGIQIYY